MKIKINGVLYPIDDGSTLTENYNETLDSALVRISHLENEIDIEPFDEVELYDGDNKYRDFCIDSWTCTQEAIGQGDTTFTYTIDLFSLTKKMENVILPNVAITPHREDPISIYDYCVKIRDLYAPKYWDENNYRPQWCFSDNFVDKFAYIQCPETQWTTPTFREVLNQLTMIGDGILILRKKKENEVFTQDTEYLEVIDYIDLTKTQNAMIKPFNYIQKSMSSDDYVSEIRMELQNVMQTNTPGINDTVTTSELIPLTSDDSIITSENCYLKTQFPILNIKHLWMILVCADGLVVSRQGVYECNATIKIKRDLCNIKTEYNDENTSSSLVYEQQAYEEKNALYRKNIIALNDINFGDNHNISTYYSKYKNFCLHYVRNSNKIEGFNQLSKALFSTETQTLEYLKKIVAMNGCAAEEIAQQYGIYVASHINDARNSYFSTFFQIEYETTYNAVFSASKGKRPRNSRVIADNQTNAWVDAYSQGFLEYQKANRLGNMQKMYNQRTIDTNDLYVIGDKINDDIVYRTEYQIYPDHIECNANTTKNYVLQNYFTGIKSKIRTWVNAKEEAFIRHDLIKYYCELSYTQKETHIDLINNNKELAKYLLSSLKNEQVNNPIKYVLIRTQKGVQFYPSSSAKYALNCITRLIGNSIVITTGFEDNWVAGKHANTGTRASGESYDGTNPVGIINKNDIMPVYYQDNGSDQLFETPYFDYPTGSNKIGGVTTNYYKYCDENGEFDAIIIYYLNALKVSNYESLPNNDSARDLFIDIFNLPLVNDSVSNTYKFGISEIINKDNKEKPMVSTQFEFIKDDDSIEFTKLFLQRQEMISLEENSNALKVIIYDENMQQIDVVSASDYITISTINDYSAVIRYIGITTGIKYIAIATSDLEPIITYDITKNTTHSLFLNIRRYL